MAGADVDAVAGAALEAWRSMRTRADVAEILTSGRRTHEMPFSYRVSGPAGPVVLRGTIDCLVERDDRSVVVFELKTGARHPTHQQQLNVYIEAARALFPGARVEGVLIYPEE